MMVSLPRYVPEVARFPRQWIYEPWLAPVGAQKAAGCLVGRDYPRPIVDHAKVSKVSGGSLLFDGTVDRSI